MRQMSKPSTTTENKYDQPQESFLPLSLPPLPLWVCSDGAEELGIRRRCGATGLDVRWLTHRYKKKTTGL